MSNKLEKRCSKCHEIKPRCDFHKNKSKLDGLENACSLCESIRSVKRCKTEHRKKYFREYFQKNREYFNSKVLEYYHKSDKIRQQHFVSTKVFRAKRKGIIEQQPCLVCGNEKSEAHHEDYNKPFKILWLCREHHRWVHRVKRYYPEVQNWFKIIGGLDKSVFL